MFTSKCVPRIFRIYEAIIGLLLLISLTSWKKNQLHIVELDLTTKNNPLKPATLLRKSNISLPETYPKFFHSLNTFFEKLFGIV
eukprot:UN09995